MKKTSKIVGMIFLAMLSAALSAGVLSAQDFQGSFTLPFESRWGTAILPAGDYTIKLDTGDRTRFQYVVTVRGENYAAMILSFSRKSDTTTKTNELVVARSGHKGTVRALRLAELQLAFNYPAPKGEPPMVAQEPELLQRIPVVVYGK